MVCPSTLANKAVGFKVNKGLIEVQIFTRLQQVNIKTLEQKLWRHNNKNNNNLLFIHAHPL